MPFAGWASGGVVSASAIGAPDGLDPAKCASLAIAKLSQCAGGTMALSSFSLAPGSAELGASDIAIGVRIDRRTLAVAFISLEARNEEAVVFSARGVFTARTRTP
jgi:hypothetical protein